MIGYTEAKKLVAEANAVYNVMLAEGNWQPLARARRHADSNEADLADVALSVIAECRNPSPVETIADLRFLVEKAQSSTGVNVKRYFVAVFQTIFHYQSDFFQDNVLLPVARLENQTPVLL